MHYTFRSQWIAEGLGGFTEIQKNEVINWWELAGCDVNTSEWDIIPFPILQELTEDLNNHPVLTWDAPLNWSPAVQVYEIQRAIIKTSGPNNFQTIHTQNGAANRVYTDLTLFIPAIGGKLAQYRVKAVFAEESSAPQFSNIRKINVSNLPSLLVEGSLLEQFSLSQNYPNPFNPSTTLKFSIPKDGYVSLRIYNIEGQEVAMLLDEHRTAGVHSIHYDASKLAVGTYFYTLTSGKLSETKKFTLMK